MEFHTLITGHRTNEIVCVLTIISTVTLPFNLVVGFWGMNFENLWLVHHPLGIWLVALLMVLISLALIIFSRAKDWI
jgi:Mg2+ and Co2+ transporter CorA